MQAKIKKLVFEVQFDNESSPYHGKLFTQSYLKRFISFRESIIANLRDYISVDVVPKQPPKYYSPVQVQGNNYLYHDLKHNKLVHFPRKGSFEVTIDNFLVFSRLQTGKWPDTEALTEWAFKVAQKMLDVEIDKERLVIQNSKQQIYSGRDTFTLKISNNSSERRRKSTNKSFIQQKLPRIGQNIDQRNSIVSNFTTLPVKPASKYSNFADQNPQQKQDMPKGFSKNDFQKTQRVFRYSNNKQQPIKRQRVSEQGQKIYYYSDSKPRSKHQSFHWNLGTPLNMSVEKVNTRDGDILRETVYRNKKIELEPLRKQILEFEKTPLDSLKITKQLEEKIEKIDLKVSSSNLNTFRGLHQIQGNLITKKMQVEPWTPILCQNVLPLKGQYYFTIGVVQSPQNTIKIGIVPLNYYPDALLKEERKDQFFIAYDCSNGMIRDSKLDQQCDATCWRLGGESAPRKKSYQIRVTIDMDANYIDWYIQQDIVASSKISRAFNQGFRVILNLAEENDCIILNDENWRDKVREEDGKFYLKEEFKKEEQPNEQAETLSPQKIEIPKQELTIDEGIQTSFVGTIKKQRVTKFIQRKRNVSAINDESIIEQQMLHQYNSRRLDYRIIYQTKGKDSVEPKPNVAQVGIKSEIKPQLQTKHAESKSDVTQVQVLTNIEAKLETKSEVKPSLQTTHAEQKLSKAQTQIQSKNIESLNIQMPQKNTQELSSLQKSLPQRQHKDQQPTKIKQEQKLIIGVQQPSKPEVSKEQPSKIEAQPKLQVAKSPVLQKILETKPQVSKKKFEMSPAVIVEKEEKMEWVAVFQDKSFKLKPKNINE